MATRNRTTVLAMIATGLLAFALPAAGNPLAPAWAAQLGTSGNDYSRGVSVDSSGNAYCTGYTGGSLAGPNQGFYDAYLAKYSSTGGLLWTTQIGTSSYDIAWGVSVDSAGNAYITGRTEGSMGGPNQGNYDAYLAKYSPTGGLLWTTQLGTSSDDDARSVCVDSAGNAYTTGFTQGSLDGTNQGGWDAYLAKYSSTGGLVWKTQLGTIADDRAFGVSVDLAGNAYITGETYGNLGGENQGSVDAFLAKFDSTGGLLWTTQLGTSNEDGAYGVSLDAAGNAYITCSTTGNLGGPNQGGNDAYLAKYSSTGGLLWTTLLGTSGTEVAYGVSVDAAGNAYITGRTDGSLGGPNQGGYDAFLAEYSPTGGLLWTTQFGTIADDRAFGMSVDSAGNAYITGQTSGSLGGPNQGSYDAFLVKFSPVPEPATLGLLALGGVGVIGRMVRKSRRERA